MKLPDHPDIAAALRNGYPSNFKLENQGSPEQREQYLMERFHDFYNWLMDGDGDTIDRFIAENSRDYYAFLN